MAQAWGFAEAAAVLRDAGSSISIESDVPEGRTAAATNAATEAHETRESPRRMRMPDNLQPEKMEL